MQLGMIGLGRMGSNMVRRLLRGGHECVVFDVTAAAVAESSKQGAVGTGSLNEFMKKLTSPARRLADGSRAAYVDKTLDNSSRCWMPATS